MDVHELRRSYGQVEALRGITLQLRPGTIGLVGNNGAGKSTFLKILLGLLAPTSGRGTLLGVDIARGGARLRSRLGYLPETSAVVPLLTGVEFATLSGDLLGMPHAQARRRAHEVLSYVGLGELRYRKLEEYSTGNKQKLKLAAALIHDPEVLLLDEPTNGLDPGGRSNFLRLLEDLVRETRKSVLLCTHLLGDIERLCDQVVFLHQGQVVHQGTRAEFRRIVSQRFELTWQGHSGVFLGRLRAAGAECEADPDATRAVVVVPPDWPPQRFFALAQSANVLLTQLRAEEEDLEGLFHRLTSAARKPRLEAAHGR